MFEVDVKNVTEEGRGGGGGGERRRGPARVWGSDYLIIYIIKTKLQNQMKIFLVNLLQICKFGMNLIYLNAEKK